MSPDSVVNLAALAALCGTAGLAGYYNGYRRKEREAEKIQAILNTLKEKEPFNKEAYCRRYFLHKVAGKAHIPANTTPKTSDGVLESVVAVAAPTLPGALCVGTQSEKKKQAQGFI